MYGTGEGVMTPPRAPHPRHVRSSARWQARFGGETRAKLEELARTFYRKRSAIRRSVMPWGRTQTRRWTVDRGVPGTVRTVGMLLEPELLRMSRATIIRQLIAQAKVEDVDVLANQGVPTMIDANHAMSHHKIMIIDGETVITGNLNFSKAAQEKNAEHRLMIRAPALAAQYTKNRDAPRQHSQPYVGRGVRQ
jgi:phosphatidylserine/phosphatidylglycerophosphate/cardiolipin synthase-like enzyme